MSYDLPLTYATDPNIAPLSGLWNCGGELLAGITAPLGLALLLRDAFFLLELVRRRVRVLKLFFI